MCKDVKYKRIYKIKCEVLKFDLEITAIPTDINITFNYILTNTGTNSIYGKILIYSKLFGKLLFDKVFIAEQQSITVNSIYSNLNQETIKEKARAYIKIKDNFWIYSNEYKIKTSYQGAMLSTDNYPVGSGGPFILRILIFSNTSINYIDGENLKGICSFSNNVDLEKLELYDLTITLLNNYIIDGQKIIIDIGTLKANESIVYIIRAPDKDPNYTGELSATFDLYVTSSNFNNAPRISTPYTGYYF